MKKNSRLSSVNERFGDRNAKKKGVWQRSDRFCYRQKHHIVHALVDAVTWQICIEIGECFSKDVFGNRDLNGTYITHGVVIYAS